MKKFKFLLTILTLACVAFTSCTDEDLLLPSENDPVVTVYDANNSAITTVTNLNAGEELPVTVKFEWGAQEKRLTKIKITTLIQGQTFTVLDSALSEGIFNRPDKNIIRKYNIAVGQTPSSVTFEAVDTKGRVGSTTVSIAPKGMSIPAVRRVVLLAGQLNTAAPYGGFYSVSVDKSYKLKDAVTNAPYIDFVYYYGATNAATLATMSDAVLYDQANGPAGIKEVMPQFQVRNATKFAAATTENFDNGTLPAAADFAAVSKTKLAVGDCLAFKTVLGFNGLIKVVKIMGSNTNGTDRAIELDVKMVK